MNRIRNRKPEAGHYDVQFPEKHLPDVNFEKMKGRDIIEEDFLEDERDLEGDVLILDPHQIPDHLPNIDFSKYLGRPVKEVDDDLLQDELVLNPDPYFGKKRLSGGIIPMDK